MKLCLDCGETKSHSEFNRHRAKPDGLQPRCRVCDNIRSRLYYDANRIKLRKQIQKSNQARRREVHRWMCEYLQTHPCMDCGIKDIRVLEFDHLDDKLENVSNLLDSLVKLKAEIAKCEVVCANCHKIRTDSRGDHYRTRFLDGRL